VTIPIDVRLILIAAVLIWGTGAERHRLIDPIEWPELDPYQPEELSSLVTESAKVVAGDAAPFDGVCVAGDSMARIVSAYDETARALRQEQRGRRGDRWDADRMHQATIEGLKTCRASHPRTFAAGVGVGFGGAAATGWIIEGARQ